MGTIALWIVIIEIIAILITVIVFCLADIVDRAKYAFGYCKYLRYKEEVDEFLKERL